MKLPLELLAWHRSLRTALLATAATVALTACPPPADEGPTCGAGTVEENGACVRADSSPTCAAGTTFDPSTRECRGDAQCGPGTTRDPATGACEPDEECGAGTTLNPQTGRCEPDLVCGGDTVFDPATGLCQPSVNCGEGTALDPATNTCVALNRCGEGTTFQPFTGQCTPNLGCGPGLTAVDGVCQSAADILIGDADVVEAIIENNDPGLGGTPETITLVPAGDALIVAGTIGRRADVDGNPEQDRDFWRFQGTAGQLLRVRLVSDGLPNGAFRITGLAGTSNSAYLRTSQLGAVEEPSRELVLTRSGTFDIEVSTRSAILDDDPVPFGDPGFGYILVVEELPLPTPIAVQPGAQPNPTTAGGDLIDLQDNFFRIQAPAGTPLALGLSTTNRDTRPVLLQFDQGGQLVSELVFSSTGSAPFTDLVAGYAVATDGVILVVDWETSNGIDGPYTLTAASLPSINLGAVEDNGLIEAPRTSLPQNEGIAYTLNAGDNQVMRVDPAGLFNTEFIVVFPNGRVRAGFDSSSFDPQTYLATQAGTWRFVFLNVNTTERGLNFGVRTLTALDAGVFSQANTAPVRLAGADLFTKRRLSDQGFVSVEHTVPMILEAEYNYRFGASTMIVHELDADGAPISQRTASFADWPKVMALREQPGTTLVQINLEDPGTSDPDPPVLDWSITMSSRPLPTLTETEPDGESDAATRQAINVGDRVRGFVQSNNNNIEGEEDEFDYYEFTIDPPLGPNEIVELNLSSLNTTSALRANLFLASGFDSSETPSTTDETFFSTSAVQTAWQFLPHDSAGPWIIELDASNNTGHDYVLELTRRTRTVEVEPNDSAATATTIAGPFSATPVTVDGRVDGTSNDFFRVDLGGPLPAGQAVLLRAYNLLDTTDIKMSALDTTTTALTCTGAGTVNCTDHEDAQLVVTPPGDGVVLFRVQGDAASAVDHYRIEVSILEVSESEPNNTLQTATIHPVDDRLELIGGNLKLTTTAADFYEFEPVLPLDLGHAWRVAWSNLTFNVDLQVTVIDGASGETVLLQDFGGGETYFVPSDPSGSVIVSVVVDGTNGRSDSYLLTVERVDAVGDPEPNNTLATAAPLAVGRAALGQSRAAQTTSTGQQADPDLYSIDTGGLPIVIDAACTKLRPIAVRVLDGEGNLLTSGEDTDLQFSLPTPPNTVIVEVTGTFNVLNNYDNYRVSVRRP